MTEHAVDGPPGMMSCAQQVQATVMSQRQLATNTWAVALRCPDIAEKIRPGQFFMVRLNDAADPLLGRPFALFDVVEEDGQRVGLEFGYVVVGKLTSRMPHWQTGDECTVWGPLGNGFPVPSGQHLMCVAGGIGQTPFLAVLREAAGLKSYGQPRRDVSVRPKKLTLCYGVRSQDYLAGLDDFAGDHVDVQIATDDGTAGHHGFVTELLLNALQSNEAPDEVFCCGPEPMMAAVAEICGQHGVKCWLSLETPMACGFGACFSCVAQVKLPDGSWDYKRTCVEGPVFEAGRLML